MKQIPFLLILIWSNIMFAQTENYKIAFKNFQSNYNEEKYSEIFNNFSPDMKSALPLVNTELFFTTLKYQMGNITNKEFVNSENGTGAIYKTQFEKAILGVYISLDSQNRIAGLFIKPYEEPENIEEANINALNEYPLIISETIFSKTKKLPNNAQLSIAVIQNRETSFYGVIRDSSTIRPIKNQDKVFEIGSITKVFTSTVLASLVEENKIKLTDKINAFYPFEFKDNIKISFENLANHTSGMPRLPKNLSLQNTINPYKNYGEKEIEEYLKNLIELEKETPKTYTYSNLGTGLLGYTLGISEKTTFQKLLQEKVFKKYNMSNSYTSPNNLDGKLIKGLNKKGSTVSNWEFDVLFGGGGILSTTKDLSNFANAQFEPKNKELELTRKQTFEINEDMKIGLGWHILKSKNGNDLYFHNGETGGYSSSMYIDIENEKAVIILSNVFDINNIIDNLGSKLMNETGR